MNIYNKIQFSNPGGLIGNLSIEDLLTDNYQAKHRNRLLAEAFYLTGEVEKYGTGFIRIRKSLEMYPELAINIIDLSDFIKVELFTKDVTKDVTKELREISIKVVEIISQNSEITIPEISDILGLNQRTVKRHISTLKKEKYIERLGGRKHGLWKILKNE